MRIFVIVTSVAILAAAAAFRAEAKVTREQAQKTALEQVKETVTVKSAELEKEEGKEVWSFDLKTSSGIREIWVDARSGAIVLDKAESAADEKAEAAKDIAEKKATALGAKLTQEQAAEIALKRAKGAEVKDCELEKEHGRLVWSFDLRDSGKIREIQVDARSGALVEDKIETPAEEKAEAEADRKAAGMKEKGNKPPAKADEAEESGEESD